MGEIKEKVRVSALSVGGTARLGACGCAISVERRFEGGRVGGYGRRESFREIEIQIDSLDDDKSERESCCCSKGICCYGRDGA
jgi:hypothetical protein